MKIETERRHGSLGKRQLTRGERRRSERALILQRLLVRVVAQERVEEHLSKNLQ